MLARRKQIVLGRGGSHLRLEYKHLYKGRLMRAYKHIGYLSLDLMFQLWFTSIELEQGIQRKNIAETPEAIVTPHLCLLVLCVRIFLVL